MAAKKAVTSPSTPSTRRARNRANAATDTANETGAARAKHQAPAERPPSTAQIIGVLNNPAVHRGRAVNLADGEQPDAYVVDFLPNFAVDHRADTRAARIPCGEVTGIGGIREEIEARFLPKTGPGAFRMIGRLGGKLTGHSWVQQIDNPPHAVAPVVVGDEDEGDEWDDELEAPEAVPLMTMEQFKLQLENVRLKERLAALERHLQKPQPPPPPQPQPKSLLEQMRELKEVKTLLADEAPPQSAPALTPELVLAKAIVDRPEKFGAFAERLMQKVLGNDEGEDANSWAKTLAPLVTQLAENLPGILQAVAANAQTRAAAEVNSQPVTAPPPTPQTPPATPTTAALSGDPMAAYHALLTRLLLGLETQMPTAEAAALVNSFIVMHPQFESAVLDFVHLPTPQLLATIGQIPGAAHLPTLPHAGQWLDALRAELFADDDESAGGEGPA